MGRAQLIRLQQASSHPQTARRHSQPGHGRTVGLSPLSVVHRGLLTLTWRQRCFEPWSRRTVRAERPEGGVVTVSAAIDQVSLGMDEQLATELGRPAC